MPGLSGAQPSWPLLILECPRGTRNTLVEPGVGAACLTPGFFAPGRLLSRVASLPAPPPLTLSAKDHRCPPVRCSPNHFLFLTVLEEAERWDALQREGWLLCPSSAEQPPVLGCRVAPLAFAPRTEAALGPGTPDQPLNEGSQV